jgi:pentapeptide MXKDX repeat protein
MKFICRSLTSIAAAAATLILAGAAVAPASYAAEASVFAQDDTMGKDTMGKDTVGKDMMGFWVTNRTEDRAMGSSPGSLGKDTMGKGAMGKDTMGKDAMGKDAMGKDTMAKDSMGKDTMAKDSMKKDQ